MSKDVDSGESLMFLVNDKEEPWAGVSEPIWKDNFRNPMEKGLWSQAKELALVNLQVGSFAPVMAFKQQ